MAPHAAPSVYQNTQCVFTAGTIEPGQSQANRRPVAGFRNKEFMHRVDIVSANDSWGAALEKLAQNTAPARYYRVTATLSQIFEKRFFLEHVKTGNVSMLSEGNPILGNTFSLYRGNLKLSLDRETYERSGLSGKLDERNGNRETRSKWSITYDLQSPSMQHGRRGFDRLVYACKNISDRSLTWLCTLDDYSDEPTSLDQLSPVKLTLKPVFSKSIKTHQTISSSIPYFPKETSLSNEKDTATELYEWLSLVRLGSPRVLHDDNIDPYLSRYSAPECTAGQMEIRRATWDGIISSSWLSDLVSALIAACPAESWFAISATNVATGSLGGKGEVTVLRLPGKDSRYLMWEIQHSS